jgi:hypothetical protein
MGNKGFYILAGIFGLVMAGLIGLATIGARNTWLTTHEAQGQQQK